MPLTDDDSHVCLLPKKMASQTVDHQHQHRIAAYLSPSMAWLGAHMTPSMAWLSLVSPGQRLNQQLHHPLIVIQEAQPPPL